MCCDRCTVACVVCVATDLRMLFFAVANNICMRCHAAAAIGPLATAAAVLQLKVCCCTMADDIDTSCAQGTLVHPATKLFPLVHSFVDSGDTNPVGSWIRVDMAHFMRFLQSAHCLTASSQRGGTRFSQDATVPGLDGQWAIGQEQCAASFSSPIRFTQQIRKFHYQIEWLSNASLSAVSEDIRYMN